MIIRKRTFPPSARISVDTETTGLNTYTGARPYIVSWCWYDKKETTGFVRWPVDPFTRKVTPNLNDIQFLKSFLENPTIVKVFHNAKFDLKMLETLGINIKGRIEDTLFKLRCYHNDLPTYALKPVCAKILNMSDDDQKALQKACISARHVGKTLGWQLDKNIAPDYWMVQDRRLVEKYAVLDVIRVKRLDEWLEKQYEQDNQRPIYEKELELLKVTYAMENRGVTIDPEILASEITYHKQNIIDTKKRFLALGGITDISMKSSPQVADLLYNKLKLPCDTFTASGSPSVNLDALKKIEHPIVLALCDYKASGHALANFFDIYQNEAEKRSSTHWILHPNFQQMGARTGRFSCSKPNLQNVANDNTHKAIKPIQARRPFRPIKGYTWYSYDYSQMEVWVFASLSNETFMLDALKAGRDIHSEVANFVWGKGRDIVKEEIARLGKSPTRILAKFLLFGIIYGIGPRSAQKLIKCTYNEAQKYLDDMRRAFPGMTNFMRTYSRKAESQGYIENASGRRYFIDSDFSYCAVNYLVQGSCADLIKTKMIQIYNYFTVHKIDAGMIMMVHDELMFEIQNKFITRNLLKTLKTIMEDHGGMFPSVQNLKVEIAKISYTDSWATKKKIDL